MAGRGKTEPRTCRTGGTPSIWRIGPISSLESGGAWKPNRARTPREYLRLMGSRNPHHSPLKVLTRKFEFVWYGEHEAAEADYRETLAQLEQLGCR